MEQKEIINFNDEELRKAYEAFLDSIEWDETARRVLDAIEIELCLRGLWGIFEELK